MATINPFQAPINYAVDVQSPFEAALGGFKMGSAVAEAEAARAARERAQAAQRELTNLFKNPNATSADYARVTAFLPKDQASIVLQGFEAQTKEQQQNTLRLGTQVYTAIKSGNLPVAEMQLKEQAAALRNSGREREAQGYDDLSNLIRLNPTNAQAIIGLNIAGLPGGKDFLESADKALATIRTEAEAPSRLMELQAKAMEAQQKAANAVITAEDDQAKARAQRLEAEAKANLEAINERVARATQPFKISEAQSISTIKAAEAKFAPDKFGAELNLTQSQIDAAKAARSASDAAAAKSGAEAKRAQAAADQMARGILPAEKRPEAESKFRAEYNNQTKPFQEVKSAYGRVLVSEDTAVGDLSLIFGYMKMLDPGSVVREGEFATAQNATNVPERIQNIYNRIVDGERLTASQRISFKGQAKKLYESAGQQEAVVRQGLERIARGYGLNTANIFYTPSEIAPTVPGAPAPAPAPAPAAPAAAPAAATGMPSGFRVIR
jgi:hypothetical protein